MRTRSGRCYPRLLEDGKTDSKPLRPPCEVGRSRKRMRKSSETASTNSGPDLFDALPDELVICIMSKLSASASCPSDFFNVLLMCKRLKGLALQFSVLSNASQKIFTIKAKNWSTSAHNFLSRCAKSGNIEACYTLGMICFYCLHQRVNGASLMAKASTASHADALFSLAVIKFNGSGGRKFDKDLEAGVALCERAAFLGHIGALRELGHCLQDGFGVVQNIEKGRRFLIQANAKELLVTGRMLQWSHAWEQWRALLSDFGLNVAVGEEHVANRFLVEWFGMRRGVLRKHGLRLCSHEGCGKPETRRYEFRRCSACEKVNYCSRACQTLDWNVRHKGQCRAGEMWGAEEAAALGGGVGS